MQRFKSGLKIFLAKNRGLIVFAMFLFFAGACIGGAFVGFGKTEVLNNLKNISEKYFSAGMIQSIDKNILFFYMFFDIVICGIFFTLAGIWLVFIPVAAVRLFAEGFKTGFLAALFAGLYGIKGTMFAILAVWFRLAFLIPLFVAFFSFVLKCGILGKQNGKYYFSKRKQKFFIAFLCFVVCALPVCFAESRIVPFAVKIWGALR